MRPPRGLAALASALALLGCAEPHSFTDGGAADAQARCANPTADEDGDGIPDQEEGCSKERDTDGDGLPDYRDPDSDNDGIPDRDEDVNGDGLLGCCVSTCGLVGAKQRETCAIGPDGCGPGQKCLSGACAPGVHVDCSDGETDPRKKYTFADGKPDGARGIFICRDATEDRPRGRKPVRLHRSTLGDWHVALEQTTAYQDLALPAAAPKEAAAVLDDINPAVEVAGFVVSRDTGEENLQQALADLLQALHTKLVGAQLAVRASGTSVKSHDRYDGVQGTTLDISLPAPGTASALRNDVLGALLGRSTAKLGALPGPYGASETEMILRFLTLRRFEFKKDGAGALKRDAKGDPVDSGDKAKWRLLLIGAVATRKHYQDLARATRVVVDDLSGGTALATAADVVENECDLATVTKLPMADIIWVMDESNSMDDNRQDIINHASELFSRAMAAGLDFRMGVTNVCDPSGPFKSSVGKFCSRVSTDPKDDGGDDRFLLPSELFTFFSCIKNPPGFEEGNEFGLVNALEAVKRHLPRASGAPDRIRAGAQLVIIVATDEVPQSLYKTITASDPLNNLFKCTLDGATQSAVQQALQPYLDSFSGKSSSESAAMLHVIGGVCQSTCGAQVAHGYRELAQQLGGQVGDVCQKDLGGTLQLIIDSVTAATSPVKLERVPISASLAVALDGTELKRSQSSGFDYRGAQNAVVLINTPYKIGSEVVASYKRWKQQTQIE